MLIAVRLAAVPVVSLFGGLFQACKAILKEQALQAGQVRVGGGQSLTPAPRVRTHRPEPAHTQQLFKGSILANDAGLQLQLQLHFHSSNERDADSSWTAVCSKHMMGCIAYDAAGGQMYAGSAT